MRVCKCLDVWLSASRTCVLIISLKKSGFIGQLELPVRRHKLEKPRAPPSNSRFLPDIDADSQTCMQGLQGRRRSCHTWVRQHCSSRYKLIGIRQRAAELLPCLEPWRNLDIPWSGCAYSRLPGCHRMVRILGTLATVIFPHMPPKLSKSLYILFGAGTDVGRGKPLQRMCGLPFLSSLAFHWARSQGAGGIMTCHIFHCSHSPG